MICRPRNGDRYGYEYVNIDIVRNITTNTHAWILALGGGDGGKAPNPSGEPQGARDGGKGPNPEIIVFDVFISLHKFA